MFPIKKIPLMIKTIDQEIYNYASTFATEKVSFDTLTSNISYICNERTMSSFTNEQIRSYLNSNGFATLLYVNEFAIEFTNGLNQAIFDALKKELEKYKRESPWNRCFVDGYFKVNNIIDTENNTHLFVEYKMDSAFVYLELANDYLKYKAITYKNESGTIFVYAIFDKEELYPTILSKYPHFEFLRKKITKNAVTGTKRVYIYVPQLQKGLSSRKPIEEYYSGIKQINIALSLAKKVNELKEKVQKSIPQEDFIYINSMKAFNSRVAKSRTLQEYYGFIKRLWDKCQEIDFFSDLESIFECNSEALTPQKIIDEGSTYRANLGRFLTDEDRISVIKSGFHPVLNVSLFIVAFLDFFDERFNIGVDAPKYRRIKMGKKKDSDSFGLIETVNEFKRKLNEHYKKDEKEERKIKKLAYSLMYYFVNLFRIIYKINDNMIIDGYNDDFEYFSILERLQNSIDDIARNFKFKNKIIAEDIIENGKSDSYKNLLKLVNRIIYMF